MYSNFIPRVYFFLPAEHVVDDVEREHAHAHRDVGGRERHDEEVGRDLRVSFAELERGQKYWQLILSLEIKR